MKFQSGSQWLLLPRPDRLVERPSEPTLLDLEDAVAWIKERRPLLWVGSIFSVPEPSGFPSGYAVTRSLFDLLFPSDSQRPEVLRDRMLNELIPRWPLEVLLDQFEYLNYDLSESLLEFFAELDRRAEPNILHEAVARYYEKGHSVVPLCLTTNWDTLLEKAFRAMGFRVNVGGPKEMPGEHFGKPTEGKVISVYHPHGSFETRDVVCSFFQEQRQLSLHMDFLHYPLLLLGYSGYEPSLYRHLESGSPQLWCIRDKADLEIPAKRRLLCRPNTWVFVGDMLVLLRVLGILNEDVDLFSKSLALIGKVPPKVVDVIQCGIAARSDPRFCSDLLAETILASYSEPELSFRYGAIMGAIEAHIRNRIAHSGLPLGLMAATSFRNHEQLWISLLAYLLRFGQGYRQEMVDHLLTQADRARKELEHTVAEADSGSNTLGSLLQARTRCYKSFLGKPEREGDNVKEDILTQIPSIYLGDMSLGGELAELAAFACLRDGDDDRARGYFDTAATYYYLSSTNGRGVTSRM